MISQERAGQAHDALVKLLEAPMSIDQTALQYISAALDVLCWILEHPHNPSFGGNLDRLERALDEVPTADGTVQ